MLKLLRFLGPRYRGQMIEIGIYDQLSANLRLIDPQTKLELIDTVSTLGLNAPPLSTSEPAESAISSTLKDLVQSFSPVADGITKLRALTSIKTEISKQSSSYPPASSSQNFDVTFLVIFSDADIRTAAIKQSGALALFIECLKDPNMLVFDEAASAIDEYDEITMQELEDAGLFTSFKQVLLNPKSQTGIVAKVIQELKTAVIDDYPQLIAAHKLEEALESAMFNQRLPWDDRLSILIIFAFSDDSCLDYCLLERNFLRCVSFYDTNLLQMDLKATTAFLVLILASKIINHRILKQEEEREDKDKNSALIITEDAFPQDLLRIVNFHTGMTLHYEFTPDYVVRAPMQVDTYVALLVDAVRFFALASPGAVAAVCRLISAAQMREAPDNTLYKKYLDFGIVESFLDALQVMPKSTEDSSVTQKSIHVVLDTMADILEASKRDFPIDEAVAKRLFSETLQLCRHFEVFRSSVASLWGVLFDHKHYVSWSLESGAEAFFVLCLKGADDMDLRSLAADMLVSIASLYKEYGMPGLNAPDLLPSIKANLANSAAEPEDSYTFVILLDLITPDLSEDSLLDRDLMVSIALLLTRLSRALAHLNAEQRHKTAQSCLALLDRFCRSDPAAFDNSSIWSCLAELSHSETLKTYFNDENGELFYRVAKMTLRAFLSVDNSQNSAWSDYFARTFSREVTEEGLPDENEPLDPKQLSFVLRGRLYLARTASIASSCKTNLYDMYPIAHRIERLLDFLPTTVTKTYYELRRQFLLEHSSANSTVWKNPLKIRPNPMDRNVKTNRDLFASLYTEALWKILARCKRDQTGSPPFFENLLQEIRERGFVLFLPNPPTSLAILKTVSCLWRHLSPGAKTRAQIICDMLAGEILQFTDNPQEALVALCYLVQHETSKDDILASENAKSIFHVAMSESSSQFKIWKALLRFFLRNPVGFDTELTQFLETRQVQPTWWEGKLQEYVTLQIGTVISERTK